MQFEELSALAASPAYYIVFTPEINSEENMALLSESTMTISADIDLGPAPLPEHPDDPDEDGIENIVDN